MGSDTVTCSDTVTRMRASRAYNSMSSPMIEAAAFFAEASDMFWSWASGMQSKTELLEAKVGELQVSKAFSCLIRALRAS